MDDANYFANLYITKNPESKRMVFNIINGKKYADTKNIKMLQQLMIKCHQSMYIEDALELIYEHYTDKDSENIHLCTLIRIIKNKKYRSTPMYDQIDNSNIWRSNRHNLINVGNIAHMMNNSSELYTNDSIRNYKNAIKKKVIVKKCPHCDKEHRGTINTQYVICGFDDDNNKGLNWDGYCWRDWCFVCGKKLCKSWGDDQLFLEPNRIHNNHCCKDRAPTPESYATEYCACSHKYVHRDIAV